ncbi:hypothetical protein [Pseudoalteromonas sp. MMG007]|uniref:hypothetical protein n=1 Tax=Pseudoalteromonas sp. MMG007 TaxID=2822684 RepID=UPI001B374D46|nr:hypothetical protein [Pseudoalteromonas sp. MMG007]MBQ4859055.1 hypothetical protein [Pseudoalteromonas sp. MMG007]
MNRKVFAISFVCGLTNTGYCSANDFYVQPKLNSSISQAFNSLANDCQDFKADTQNDHVFEISDHHQAFELSHKWSNGSHTAFIAHSETSSGDLGQILTFDAKQSVFNNNDVIKSDTTLPLRDKIRISEQHPSGIAWLPAPNNKDEGYLFIASENEIKVRVRRFNSTSDLGQSAELIQTELNKITDVWLAQVDDTTWLILHHMGEAKGVAYKADSKRLFQYNTPQEGNIDINAFERVNSYQTAQNTPCNSVGQNAQLIQDNANNWYVVHSYTGGNICGANIGNNQLSAYPVSFNDNTAFSVSTLEPAVQTTLGSAAGPTDPGADGASGFRVNENGQLIAYLGAQYAYSSFFNWKSALRECRSSN